MKTEFQKRDEALELYRRKNKRLIRAALKIAIDISQKRGRVTSRDVFRRMHKLGYRNKLREVDPRFMGAVFCAGFTRIGYENTGSNGRPQSIWKWMSAIDLTNRG